MLGQALSRQAEEEERQRREAEEAALSTPPDVAALNHAPNDPDADIVGSGHGDADGLIGSSIGGPIDANEHGDGLRDGGAGGGGGGGRYGSILSNSSDLEGGAFVVYEDDDDDAADNSDYSYNDDDDDDDEEEDEDEYGDDDDSNLSSYDDDDDDDLEEMAADNEGAYLLQKQLRRRQRRRRRRKKRRQEKERQLLEKENQKARSRSPLVQTLHRWKISLRRKARKVGSRLRAAIVAIADVDNVWDSPDASGGNPGDDGNVAYNHQRRMYDEQGPNRDANGKRHSIGFTGSAANGQNMASSHLQQRQTQRIPFLRQQNNPNQTMIQSHSDLQHQLQLQHPQSQNQQHQQHQHQQQQQPSRSTLIYNAITGGTANARNKTAALFWFLLLSFSYASERSTFKLIVDRVGPFRLFSAELIVGAHAILLGLVLVGGVVWQKKLNEWSGRGGGGGGGSGNRHHYGGGMESGGGLGVPLADVGLMAVLDTVYLLLGVISGAHVPPVLTVILVQTTIPLTACFTQCVHPDGRCVNRRPEPEPTDQSSPAGNSTSHNRTNILNNNNNINDANSPAASSAARSNIRILSDANDIPSISDYPEISTIPNVPPQPPPPVKGWGGLSRYHILGTGLLTLAILIGLMPAVLSLDQIVITKKDAIPIRTAYNTIVFCLAAIPAAMSQLYKEHTLTRIRQPIDRNQLNMVLSIFQLLFAIVVSPLAYGLQGMGDGPGWTTLYPSKQIGENFSNGLKCFVGTLDEETMKHGYPEVAECDWAWLLVLLHVFSIVMVAVAIDKLAAATKVMYRGVSMGIMFAVLFMFIYQSREKWCEYGPLVNMMHFTSTVVLIVGAEIYHRVSLADATFETVYQEIGDLYLEEE